MLNLGTINASTLAILNNLGQGTYTVSGDDWATVFIQQINILILCTLLYIFHWLSGQMAIPAQFLSVIFNHRIFITKDI